MSNRFVQIGNYLINSHFKFHLNEISQTSNQVCPGINCLGNCFVVIKKVVIIFSPSLRGFFIYKKEILKANFPAAFNTILPTFMPGFINANTFVKKFTKVANLFNIRANYRQNSTKTIYDKRFKKYWQHQLNNR